MPTIIKFKRLTETAIIPTKAHIDDLGLDLYSNEDVVVPSLSNKLVSTGIVCEFPPFIGGILKDRSSVASKQRLYVKAGVIDPSYRGEIRILLENPDATPKTIKAGTKIAQMVLVKTEWVDIEETSEVNDTERGEKGFGSSDTR